jgi:phosphoserine aminotransferase
MSQRVWNFNPGPAVLPLSVLEKAMEEMTDFKGTGMSIMEHSHRGKAYAAVHEETKVLLAELLGIPSNMHILFLQGGASLQFAMVPMNLLPAGRSADYLNTGEWSQKAIKEAKMIGTVQVASSSEATKFDRIPKASDISFDPKAVYVHITSNETIHGCQWPAFPDPSPVPMIADMSSDILSRTFDIKPFGMIYAGAQKNLGPSGVTLVIIREDLLAACRKDIPTMLRYPVHSENDSLYNTPPTFGIYLMKLVLEWVKGQGGLKTVEARNREKAKLLYKTIDDRKDFYKGTVQPDSRSLMNAPFRLPSEDLEARFIAEAQAAKFVGLKGHRSVGGIRVSMYNAMTLEGIKALTDFMVEFAKKNG